MGKPFRTRQGDGRDQAARKALLCTAQKYQGRLSLPLIIQSQGRRPIATPKFRVRVVNMAGYETPNTN